MQNNLCTIHLFALTAVPFFEYIQVFINFAMESMSMENIPPKRGEESDDPTIWRK